MFRVYATSDHHFFHRNIIRYARRPFDINDPGCVQENIDMMISRHNEVVRDQDVVFFLGDILIGTKEKLEVTLGKMRGTKLLILGNHDREKIEVYEKYFQEIYTFLKIGDIMLSHYPCYHSKWTRPQEKKQINIIKKSPTKTIIHGHIHNVDPGKWKPDGLERINVSVDFTPRDFRPTDISFPEVVDYVINNIKT